MNSCGERSLQTKMTNRKAEEKDEDKKYEDVTGEEECNDKYKDGE